MLKANVKAQYIKRTEIPGRTDLNKIRKMYSCPLPGKEDCAL